MVKCAADLQRSTVQPQIVLDLLFVRWVQASDQGQRILTCSEIDGVHPQEGHGSECSASQIPIVPLDTILLHHVPSPSETAFCEDWRINSHQSPARQCQRTPHRHCANKKMR